MPYLILVRHGKSQWNARGLWTGWKDIGLNKEGKEDAKRSAKQLKDIKIDKAYVSKLKRAIQTLYLIKKTLKISSLPTIEHESLNERDYGDYTGKNKWQIKKALGEETFQKIRRSWDYPIPKGESMKDVYSRVVPYYKKTIFNDLKSGKNIIVIAHGNSMRALVMHLENLTEEELMNLEIGIGEVWIYKIDKSGKIISKEVRAKNPNRGKI